MDRLTQTAIMTAAIGAVVVVAGVMISFQSRLDRTEAAKADTVQSVSAAPRNEQVAATQPAQSEASVAFEDDLDLSSYGKPIFDTSLPTNDTGGEDSQAAATDAEESQMPAAENGEAREEEREAEQGAEADGGQLENGQ